MTREPLHLGAHANARASGGGQVCAARTLEVGQHHGRTVGVEPAGGRLAEAGASAGDEGNGLVVDLHVNPFQAVSSWREMTSRWIWLVPS